MLGIEAILSTVVIGIYDPSSKSSNENIQHVFPGCCVWLFEFFFFLTTTTYRTYTSKGCCFLAGLLGRSHVICLTMGLTILLSHSPDYSLLPPEEYLPTKWTLRLNDVGPQNSLFWLAQSMQPSLYAYPQEKKWGFGRRGRDGLCTPDPGHNDQCCQLDRI